MTFAVAELVVLVLVLSPDDSARANLGRFVSASAFALWLALTIATVLCATRRWISRLPVAGQKFCLGLSLLLMLFICWLVFKGSLEQTKINWESTSAVMETSMGYFYASGVVFAVLAAPILLLNLVRLVTGQMPDSELIGIRESYDMPHGDPHP